MSRGVKWQPLNKDNNIFPLDLEYIQNIYLNYHSIYPFGNNNKTVYFEWNSYAK